MPTALLILPEGAEEIEAVVTADVLRRADINVTIASLSDNINVKCSRDVNIKADTRLSDIVDNLYDAVILPGGQQCAQTLSKSSDVRDVLVRHHQFKYLIAAICASPTVLSAHGIALGKRVTCYPDFKHKMSDYTYSEKNVVVDGNILTSRGPGTSFEFAFEIVNILRGRLTMDKIKKEMLL